MNSLQKLSETNIMKLTVSLYSKTFAVNPVDGDFDDIAEIKHNSQHYQFPGSVLVDITIDVREHIFRLYHPETKADTGHYDISVHFAEDKVEFRKYSGFTAFNLDNTSLLTQLWPGTGRAAWEIVRVVDAIEQYLQKHIGREPVLQDQIIRLLSMQAKGQIQEVELVGS